VQRPWDRNLVDVVVAIGFVGAAMVEALVAQGGTPGLAAFQVLGALWLGVLAVRRSRPVLTLGVITGAALVGSIGGQVWWPQAPDDGGVWILAMMLAAYSLGAHARTRQLVLGALLPLVIVVASDATTRSGWQRVSGIVFVTLFIGALPTAVGRLVRARHDRLETLRAQHERIARATRAQQEAAVLAERLRTFERLRPTLVEGLRDLAAATETVADPRSVEERARQLLGRTREEVVALTAHVDHVVEEVEPVRADPVRALRATAQPWVVLAAGALTVGLVVETPATLHLLAPAWTVVPAALGVGASFALLWWRPIPAVAAVYVAVAVFSHVVARLDGSLSEVGVAMGTVFAVAALSRRRDAVLGLLVCCEGQLVAITPGDPLGDVVTLIVVWCGGLAVHEVSRLVEQTRVNTELLAGQEAAAAARAVVEERFRLAREVHDALGHSLTVVALQAGAARRLEATDPRRATEVMATAAAAARDGISSLQLEGPTVDVAGLVERIRATGLDVDGDLAEASQLEPSVGLVVLRVVQESLTNVLRHAPGAAATVVVRRHDGGVEVRVANSTPRRRGTGPGTGRGLSGLRERVVAESGRLTWRAVDGGGFEVLAWLPVGSSVSERVAAGRVEVR
jgi:signal transduction histidine kinase